MTPLELPEKLIAMLKSTNLGTLVTLNEDGSPHSSPIWADTDGTHIIINTVMSRVKGRNMQRDPRVAFSIFDCEEPLTRFSVRGRVVEVTAENAEAHIDELAQRYSQKMYWDHHPDKPRAIVKIAAHKIHR